MFEHLRIGHTLGVGACGMLIWMAANVARADAPRPAGKSDARACQAAYQSGQEKEKSGLLVEASRLFAECSDEVCGVSMWQTCIAKSTQLHGAVPSVVPMVVDDSGDPRVDIQVKMDGRVIASRLTGRAIPVDPGTHEFSFSTSGGVFASKRITIAKGERNRTVSAIAPRP